VAASPHASPIDLNLYLDHVLRPRYPVCGCSVKEPNYMCDVGFALFQAEKKAKAERQPVRRL
jgi:hypothetical protein